MSAHLVTTPSLQGFTKNAMPVMLQTTSIAIDRAYLELTLTDYDGPSPNETFSFTYNGVTRTFIFATTPDNSGWQLPTRGNTQAVEDWWLYLSERIRINYTISQEFDIVADFQAFKIRLSWHNTEPLSITQTNNLSYLFVAAHSVASISNTPNLGAFITVHDATTHQRIIALSGSYNETAQCYFDIRAVFQSLSPHLPFGFYGFAQTAFQKYYIRYADKYGSPAIPEIMHKSQTFTAICGGTTSQNNDLFSRASIIPLHNWATRTGETFVKEVTKEQPDWLYFTAQYGATGLTQEIVIHLSDETTVVLSVGVPFDMEPGVIRFIETGFRQIGLHFFIFPRNVAKGTFLVGYDVRIKNSLGHIELTARYELELYNQHAAIFILFDTGLGGMETVRLKGKRQLKYEVERAIIENFEGERSTIFPSGSEMIDVSTGWYDLYYLEQLRQLLLGDIYLVQRTSPLTQTGGEYFAFKKCIADTKTFEFLPDDNELHSLNFSFKLAKSDTQINNY